MRLLAGIIATAGAAAIVARERPSMGFWLASLAGAAIVVAFVLSYVSVVSQFLAFFIFNAAMAMIGVARVGQLMLLQPFVIVVLAAPVNGEPIRLTTLLYAAAVVATVVIGQRMQVRRD